MAEQSAWMQKVAADPAHSSWYVERFRSMAAAGRDLAGEARLLDAMVGRGARILDAGCGHGRVAAELARLGHDVVGVDVDPVLIEAAAEDHPGPRWIVEDLAELDLSAHGVSEPFDAIVCAGNVMTFLAPSTRHEELRRLRGHVHSEGRVLIGFGASRGYEFSAFLTDAGLTPVGIEEALLAAKVTTGGGRPYGRSGRWVPMTGASLGRGGWKSGCFAWCGGTSRRPDRRLPR